MVKRTTPTRVISFLLLAACGASCQKRPSADLLRASQFDVSNSPEIHLQAVPTLPDAPSSVRPPAQADGFHRFVNEKSSSLTLSAASVMGAMRVTELGHVTPRPQPNLTAHYQAAFIQKDSSNFPSKDPYPSLFRLDPRYLPSTSSSFMGRATYAASRIFIKRDNSGKGRLNTSYFLGVLSSVASAAARRPYWARSSSGAFNNFGSTIGGDAGMNVFHEFGPGIRQVVKSLTPKFVSRIEARVTRDQMSRNVVSIPAR
jgi:hypothetical protein